MIKHYLQVALLFCSILIFVTTANAKVKGIYVTQYSLENTAFLNYLIKHAKESGINTFVVDLELPSKRYEKNIKILKENNIHYVARIIVFPNGGTREAIKNPSIWQKKYRLVKQAVDYGAKEIQLDYIRYTSKQKPSDEHAKDILTIIQWYKNQLSGQNIPLQVDVFGITSFGESKHIGQNIQLFSKSVDAVCPMVYPSHYHPFEKHYKTPYETVYSSLKRIQKMFNHDMPIRMYAYIELSNYHYPQMSRSKKLEYIKAQIKAVEAANADGWYAWSPHNRYDNLFDFLKSQKGIVSSNEVKPDVVDKIADSKACDEQNAKTDTADKSDKPNKTDKIEKLDKTDKTINTKPSGDKDSGMTKPSNSR